MLSTFYIPTRLVFGPGSIARLGEEARQLGQRAMVVTYPDIRRVGWLDKVTGDLGKNGVEAVVYDELEPNPRNVTIDRGAVLAREEKIGLVIGLGGGSVMDAAKGIALASTGSASIWEYVMGTARAGGDLPALIQVPTLAGTGSELNQIAVFTDWGTHEKRIIFHPGLWAKIAIVDPAVTVTVPKTLTASGGVDAFSHLVEWYLMPERPLPVNDAVREGVMRVIVKTLPKLLEHLDDVEARTQISWASTIASSDLSRLGGTAGSMTCHAIEHAVSGYYDINHGAGLAALLPAWMRHLQSVRPQRFALLGRNVFGKPDGIAAFEKWLKSMGMKLRLRDLGCKLEHAGDIAAIALRTWNNLESFPGNLDAATIAQIYQEAY
jgi:alcohol dehydrogenase YqhD (iron-dependent ADH family)